MQDYSGYGGYGQPPSGDFGPTAPLPPIPPRPPRRRIGLLSYLGVALAAGALGAGTVVALYHPTANSSAVPQPRSSVPAPSSTTNSSSSAEWQCGGVPSLPGDTS